MLSFSLSFPQSQKTKNSLGPRIKKSIISTPARILHAQSDSVTTLSSLSEIIVLEVKRLLCESVSVQEIMHTVGNIKSVDTTCIDVGRYGGIQRGLIRVIELDASVVAGKT